MRARERGDDARRHRLADAEGIADGEHDIADLDRIRIAEGEMGKLLLAIVDAQNGEVRAFVGKDELRLELAPVGERDGELVAALDDMEIGDDEAGGIDDDAGAERLLHALARHAEAEAIAEKLLEEGVVEEGRPRLLLHDPLRIDVDDGGRDALHHRRIGELDLAAARRHSLPGIRPRGPGKKSKHRTEKNRRERHRESARPGRLRQHFHHHCARPGKDGHSAPKAQIQICRG